MNQMLQDAPEVKDPPDTVGRPPAPAHPRFAKPQRVAFVQSSWHREVVEECRIAFLEEIEARCSNDRSTCRGKDASLGPAATFNRARILQERGRAGRSSAVCAQGAPNRKAVPCRRARR